MTREKTARIEINSDYVWPFCRLAEPAVEGLERTDTCAEIAMPCWSRVR